MTEAPEKSPIPVLVITGPTASGKTSAAVSLARRIGGEVVGADSMQVYRGMDIGTATPAPVELQGVPHHIINIVDPDEEYDGARFVEDADRAIGEIHGRGKRVIIAGGTGMYLRLLLKGLQAGPSPLPELRRELEQRATRLGWPALHRELSKVDEETASRLHPNDGVRIVRALEVYLQSGRSISQWQREHGFAQDRYPFRMLGVQIEKAELNRRIETRVDQMVEAGFVDEVRGLLENGYDGTLKPMMGLGYRRMVEYLDGACSLEEAVENTKTDTRRFAKRQRTWFKKEPVEWFDGVEELLEVGGCFFKN